jgi:hypothetical protein
VAKASTKAKTDIEIRVDGLYDAAPEEFTATRNELAKELRKSGERESADEVARLKKPTAPAWAINQLARRDPPAITRVLEAGKRLRKAQETALGGGSGSALRDAAASEREAVGQALEKASGILGDKANAANVERVRGSLHAAAGDEDVRSAIEKGRLTADHTPVGLGPFGAATPSRAAAPTRRDKPSAAARKRITDAQRASREATRRLEAARRELERRSDAAERAQERLVAAKAELDEAESEAETAATDLERAEREA